MRHDTEYPSYDYEHDYEDVLSHVGGLIDQILAHNTSFELGEVSVAEALMIIAIGKFAKAHPNQIIQSTTDPYSDNEETFFRGFIHYDVGEKRIYQPEARNSLVLEQNSLLKFFDYGPPETGIIFEINKKKQDILCHSLNVSLYDHTIKKG